MNSVTKEMLETRNEYLVLISNLTGVPADDIMSRKRTERITTARHLLMWVLTSLCGYTTLKTAVLLGRNYSMIVYGREIFVGGGRCKIPNPETLKIAEKLKKYHKNKNTKNG